MKRKNGIAKPLGQSGRAAVNNPTASGAAMATPEGVGIGRRKVWTKKWRPLADMAIAMRERGEVPEAHDDDHAIRIVAAQYVKPDGLPIDAKDVIDSLKKRKREKGY